MMKATWKPHTKKPAVSSQKLGCWKASRKRLHQRLVPHRPLAPDGLAADRPGERDQQGRDRHQPDEALLPADELDQQVHHRQRHEAADAGRHADGGDGRQPLLRRRQPADGPDQGGDAGAADADTQQHAADQEVVGRAGRVHEVKAGDGGQQADDDDPPGAELVDQAAEKRRAEAQRELRQRHRQAERLAADVERLGNGRQVEAHGLGPAHRDADDGADDQDQQPERESRVRGLSLHWNSMPRL